MRLLVTAAFVLFSVFTAIAENGWQRHTIDQSFRGADGVRLADFNGDGRPDVVSGWEQSGIVRLYLHPGPANASKTWPAVSVGKAAAPEDAVPADIDGDGRLDVVSCHEGKAKKLLVHFNRADRSDDDSILDESNWSTAEFEQVRGQLWMFAAPLQLKDKGFALVAGSKGSRASISILIAPQESAADLSRWKVIRLRDAGWIMSLRVWDMDGDGDQDIVYSDRKGARRGAGWLEQPDDPTSNWTDHPIGGGDKEMMFLDLVPPKQRGHWPVVLASTRNSVWIRYRNSGNGWTAEEYPNPPDVPNGKAIARISDRQMAMTANTNSGNVKRTAGIWIHENGTWRPIGDPVGGKYDRMEILDLNGDGAPDIMTCEERQNLGVIWYENPNRSR